MMLLRKTIIQAHMKDGSKAWIDAQEYNNWRYDVLNVYTAQYRLIKHSRGYAATKQPVTINRSDILFLGTIK